MTEPTNYLYGRTDSGFVKLIGEYIKRQRLKQNRTQQEVAEKTGINRTTLVQLENGKGASLIHLIGVMRTLELLQVLNIFLEQEEFSPLQLAKLKRKPRKRARAVSTGTVREEDAPEW